MPQRLCFLTKPFYFQIASIPSVPLPDPWSKLSSQAWITGSQFIFWSPSHPVDCLIDFTGCPLKSKFLTTEYQTWPCPAASLTSAAPFNQSSPDPKCHPQWVHSPWLSPSQIPSALMHPPWTLVTSSCAVFHSALYFYMLAIFPQTDSSSLRTSIVSYSSNITYCAIQTQSCNHSGRSIRGFD